MQGATMRDQAVDELMEIADSGVPLLTRARSVLDTLGRHLPSDATWLALSDPGSNVHATVGSTGLEGSVLDYLDRPSVSREIQLAGLNRDQPPVSLAELPFSVDELPTWAECLVPAGFHDGLGVPLAEPGGPYVGMLTLLFSGADDRTADLRNRIAQLAPLIARGVSPMPSLLATARLVRGATCGVVLLRDGSTCALPGLGPLPTLVAESPVVGIGRDALLAGQVYESFMWPAHDRPGVTGHSRVTVLAAADVPAFVVGTLLVTPDAECRGLTARELEVLGMIVEGHSNQQIARRLSIAARTVAAHVEHILHKLEVPTRTQAAILAEREGCHVPPR